MVHCLNFLFLAVQSLRRLKVVKLYYVFLFQQATTIRLSPVIATMLDVDKKKNRKKNRKKRKKKNSSQTTYDHYGGAETVASLVMPLLSASSNPKNRKTFRVFCMASEPDDT